MELMLDMIRMLLRLDAQTEPEKGALLAEMPRDSKECNTYSALTTFTVLQAMERLPLEIRMLHRYLKNCLSRRQFRQIHLVFMMCMACAGLNPPPYFVECTLSDALLETMMCEMMADFDTYIETLHGKGGNDDGRQTQDRRAG